MSTAEIVKLTRDGACHRAVDVVFDAQIDLEIVWEASAKPSEVFETVGSSLDSMTFWDIELMSTHLKEIGRIVDEIRDYLDCRLASQGLKID